MPHGCSERDSFAVELSYGLLVHKGGIEGDTCAGGLQLLGGLGGAVGSLPGKGRPPAQVVS